MSNLNILDRAISYIAPGAGARRAQSRAFIDGVTRATALYDGAARSWRTANRRFSQTSANAEAVMSLGRLRGVSRDLRRNNALAHNAISVIDANVVGAGIIPTLDSATPARLKKKIQGLIASHLETTDIDVEGRNNIYGLQSLIMQTVVESGEAIIVRYLPRVGDARLSVPFQVRVYEPDYINAAVNGEQKNGNIAFEGIEIDSRGKRVAYHIFEDHPGGGVTWRLPRTIRVSAADVLHVYRVDRPGQMRGVPWCAPIIVSLSDLADYEDADLVRQKIAACFAVFLKGDQRPPNFGATADASPIGTPLEKLEPGIIQRLPPGVEPIMATPPVVTGQADFIRSKGHKIAAGYGVPYELISTDLKEVSFISGRLGLMQFNRVVDQWRWHMLIPHACDGIGRWFLEGAGIVLGVDASKVRLKHTPPRRELIEPSKEIPAIRDSIRSGLSSRSEEVRSLGFDPETIDNESKTDNERADKLGVAYDSDGRRPLAFSDKPDNANEAASGKKKPSD